MKQAVLEQAEVSSCFEDIQIMRVPGIVSLQQMRREMQQLQDKKGYFSQFNTARPPEDIDLTGDVQELQTVAPTLWNTLNTFMELIREDYEQNKSIVLYIFALCFALLALVSAQTSCQNY